MDIVKVAVLGPKGTFSDKAFLQYKEQYEAECVEQGKKEVLEPVYCATIDEVFFAVGDDKDSCDIGIVPIENTLDGYVQRTLDLLLERNVRIVDENMVAVQFALVANAASLEDIDTLYVQFVANGQCRGFINTLNNVSIQTTDSNMESYYKLEDVKGRAAVVPAHIAKNEEKTNPDRFVHYDVTDAENNHTRFVVFKPETRKDITGCSVNGDSVVRIPVYIMPKTDRPGLLYEILKAFYEKQVNLISIMSRPTKQELGTYNFYIEIDGFRNSLSNVKEALDIIRKYNQIKVLGIFGEEKNN